MNANDDARSARSADDDISDCIQFSTSATMPVEPDTILSWSDKSITEVMQLCAEYLTQGRPIPVKLMTDDQFTAYCASITRIEPEHAESSLSTIQQLVRIYDPTSETLPTYLKFTVTTGSRLLENHMDGLVDNRWNYRHPPIKIANQIVRLAEWTVGSSVGISQDTPREQRFKKLTRHFHPDKILRQYHTVYEPFLRRAYTILTIAFTVIKYDVDMPELVSDSDDEVDPHYTGPQAPYFDDSEEERTVLSNRFTSPAVAIYPDDTISMIRSGADFPVLRAVPADASVLHHHLSSVFPNILVQSPELPRDDIHDPFSDLNTPLEDQNRAKKIATGRKLLHDFRTRKLTLPDGETETDSPDQDPLNSSVFDNNRLPFSQPVTDDLRNSVSDGFQHDYSRLPQTKSRLRPDTILSSGDTYVITFRGNAHFLSHNNFQHYTDNEHMQLIDIRSLITAILNGPHVSHIMFYAAMCPSVSTQLEDLYLLLPQLNTLCLSLTAKAMHVDAILSNGQSLLLGMLSVAKVGNLPSNNVPHREAYYYTPSWYQEVSVIGIPPHLPAVTVPTHSYFRVTFTRNTNVREHDQIQHFSSTSTIYHVQTWLSEILTTVYDAPLVYPETQLHFFKTDPVLASTNLSALTSMQADVSLHVLSKSPLIHTDASEVTRIFFGSYSIHHCNASLNGREHIHLFDRREQLDSSAVRISQAEISTTVPFRLRTPGYDTDRLNFRFVESSSFC